ncbi:MAG TPA: DUF3891 family protein, partial [Anseongella sp.]|nr:DUF3891 family protein [Anseongella sp.]
MIVREEANQLVLITQPDHAEIAGTFAGNWKATAFRGYDRLEEVLFAVNEHDHCWKEADRLPLLDEETGIPYSFDNYPESIKTGLYRKGIDHLERHHPYAALLCSKHFSSFFA